MKKKYSIIHLEGLHQTRGYLERTFKYKYQSICFGSYCRIFHIQITREANEKNETQVGCRVMPFNYFYMNLLLQEADNYRF